MSEYRLGSGVLSWHRAERISDRYGTVGLLLEGGNSLNDSRWGRLDTNQVPASTKGQLVAVVTATRESTHIGDIFRGFFPETPEVGERIVLGEGEFFVEQDYVGLKPADGRDHDWLDPEKLYRAHEQTVDLFLVADVTE